MATEKISLKTIFSKPSRPPRGFTLLEIMVVLGILAAILALGVPRMNFRNGNVKTVVRQMSVLTREVRNQARLKNRTYRIVFRMAPNAPSTYWIESADGPQMAPSRETEEKLASLSSSEERPSRFQKDEGIIKEERELPSGLFIGAVETARMGEPQTEGDAHVYFSPEGLVEKAAIQVTNRQQLTWTLIINPLTGHADIMERAARLKDISRE